MCGRDAAAGHVASSWCGPAWWADRAEAASCPGVSGTGCGTYKNFSSVTVLPGGICKPFKKFLMWYRQV